MDPRADDETGVSPEPAREPAAGPVTPSFADEFRRVWRELPDKGFLAALLVPWILLFQFLGNSVLGYVETSSLFEWMYYVYTTSPDDEHGLLIPFVVAGLFWWKRDVLLEAVRGPWWPAVLLLGLGVLFHLLGFMVQQTRLSIVGFFVGLYAILGIVWGPNFLVRSFFPMFLFVFAIPLATVADALTFPLRMIVTRLAVFFTGGILGMDVIREGSMIFDSRRTFQFDVAPACSGIRSLVTLVALTTIYGFVSFQSAWKRLVMVALAVPVTILGNTARIVTVIIVSEASSVETGALIEQKLGFLTFAVAAVSVLGVGYALRRWAPEAGDADESGRVTGTA